MKKSKKISKPSRGYIRSNKAWYAEANNFKRTEVCFGLFHADGSTPGEMYMEWVQIDNHFAPRLKCFDDGWEVLASFTDLIKKMREFDKLWIQEPEFCELLDSLGFKDLTEYERPKK